MPAVDEAPYADNAALLDALRELGDTLIERALLRRQLDGSDDSSAPAAGPGRTAEAQPDAAPGASERLQALALRAEPRHAERARLTRQLAGLDASVAQRWRRHAARASASVRAAIFLPWMHVCLLFHLDTRDEALLLCALLPELDPRYAAILQALAGPEAEAAPPEPGAAHVPLASLARLAGDAEMRADSLLARLAGDAALRAWELVELSAGTRLGTLTGGYRLGAPIAAYLLARAAPQLRLDEPLATIAAGLPLDEQLVDAQALRQLARFAAVAGGDEEAGSYLLHLQGADTECLRRLAAATLARLGMHGAVLDGRAIARFDAERQRNRTELAARIKRLGRDALLCNRVLVLTHGQWLTGSQDDTDDLLDELLPLLFDSQRLIVVLNGPARRLADLAHGYQAHRAIAALIRVGSPDTALRARIWRRHLPDFPFRVDEAALAQLVNQYPFNETQIVMALKDAASRKLIDGDDSEPGDGTQRASAASASSPSSPVPSSSRPAAASVASIPLISRRTPAPDGRLPLPARRIGATASPGRTTKATTTAPPAAASGAPAGTPPGAATASNAADPDLQRLFDACREQSQRTQLAVAQEVRTRYRFDDIVLPDETRDWLLEVLHYARNRHQVVEGWGFDAKHQASRNLSVLFHGPSGTGKTMAASIIANELNLGLFRIDLASIVSKYIGETEKQLAQLFDQAEAMNVVLFFDEAEGLFAKRTDTRDAHDRYANLQTGYLLQRIETYQGIVILSTNLLQNIDKAFLRRFRFIVEYPFPSEAQRLALWRNAFPAATPLGDDLDFALLAERAPLSGGNINNIAIGAAFLAAAEGAAVGWRHLLQATEREYRKLGKVFVPHEFEWGEDD
ncbi:AAA family ATPase [Burkholderia gladioli]|uniref:AAA family ATPase n=2 Tax=Burkholderia gladioli TaxID=28095 RepID=UPI0013F5BF6E|nr:ATP-binding protein [Burkholderia gladioli]NHH84806.1 ATP-dependent zinc metalloprotease FtsH 3 [Burkholderia gladioli]